MSVAKRLENYTIEHPQEVLLVSIEIDDEADQILIFRGFSSSLMRPTSFDPDVPVLSDRAVIVTVDRLAGPYNPDAPDYLEKNIRWEIFSQRLGD
nr:hypothetical protein [Leptothoe kymatousa]